MSSMCRIPSEMPSPECIREQLRRVLIFKPLADSKRQKMFLEWIVESHLAGRGADIKETTVAVEVFGKPPDWNPGDDSVVRSTASRLRRILTEYYATAGASDKVEIALPPGHYIPQITWRTCSEIDQVLVPKKGAQEKPSPLLGGVGLTPQKLLALWIAATLAIAAAVAVMIFVDRSGPPRLLDITFEPLTHDGHPKGGRLLTDGTFVYFNETINQQLISVAVPVRGGDPVRLASSVQHLWLHSWFRWPSEFLAEGYNSFGRLSLWRWVPGQYLEDLSERPAGELCWIGGVGLARIVGQTLTVLHGDGSVHPIAVPGGSEMAWQPVRKLLRFTAVDDRTDVRSIWETRWRSGSFGSPEQLKGYPLNACCGSWTPDGNFFVFVASGQAGSDIWLNDERPPHWRNGSRPPIRLTNGPIRFESVVASADGQRVYAIGITENAQLVRYDKIAGEFVPHLGGMSIQEAEYSRDGQWVVYTTYPDRALWKMKTDGSSQAPLTITPITAIEPHWSPDGMRIAFLGHEPNGRRQIWIIDANEPSSLHVLNGTIDAGVPTWSADGTQLVFGGARIRGAPAQPLRLLNLRSGQLADMPDSLGLWNPRWSPDGHFIAALTTDSSRLAVFDLDTNSWRVLADANGIQIRSNGTPYNTRAVSSNTIASPVWSLNSKHLYFRVAGDLGDGKSYKALYRLAISRRQTERIADLANLETPDTVWYGLMPDETPLAFRQVRVREVYAVTIPKDLFR